MSARVMFVTGATGMVGSQIARRAVEQGYRVRAMVRPDSDRRLLDGLDVEWVEGDLSSPESVAGEVANSDIVVHSAAHIGDWGPAEKYRAINVVALEQLLSEVERQRPRRVKRWIQISSLGVYPGRDHYGTDETVAPDVGGLDGYTKTKAEAELLLRRHIDEYQLPAVILRPGFIYGRGERHSLPRLIELFGAGKIKFIGDGKKLLNNTYVGNLVDAVFLAIDNDDALGETFNIRDERLVTREEYLMAVAEYLGKPRPPSVPLWLARAVVPLIEGWARFTRKPTAPILTNARIKFMALNLDFSIDKAKRVLGYQPRVDFKDGIQEALEWATDRQGATDKEGATDRESTPPPIAGASDSQASES